jgi:hypothetical protein
MSEEHSKRENEYKVEMTRMEEEKSINFTTLLSEKRRVAEIVDIIN